MILMSILKNAGMLVSEAFNVLPCPAGYRDLLP
jgi:hypothetical protein